MEFVDRCGNCGSTRWDVFGAAVEERSLHYLQCRCSSCGLVFVNPRATLEELDEFYARYYRDCVPGVFSPDWEADKLRQAREHVRDLSRYTPGGRLLEVGAGTGVFLKAAAEAGFEVHGVEPSSEAVTYAEESFGITTLRRGVLENVEFPAGSFDAVYAWHVIEHVPDIDWFVNELFRLLRPGGVLYVGTESHYHFAAGCFRLARVARGRPPRTRTSSDHTFIFHPRSMRDCLSRRGFEVVDLTTYDHAEVSAHKADAAPRGRGVKGLLLRGLEGVAPVVDRILRTGRYMKVVGLKRRQEAGDVLVPDSERAVTGRT
jgi:2-polyprenyl-3-methyl-5-hydroxy-6-metoxy-1,4-benzoquinol methylase